MEKGLGLAGMGGPDLKGMHRWTPRTSVVSFDLARPMDAVIPCALTQSGLL